MYLASNLKKRDRQCDRYSYIEHKMVSVKRYRNCERDQTVTFTKTLSISVSVALTEPHSLHIIFGQNKTQN